MAEDRMMTAGEVALQAMSGEHGDMLRDAVAMVVREVMEAEVAQMTGAGRGERSEDRVTNLNGYRQRAWETRVGAGCARSRGCSGSAQPCPRSAAGSPSGRV